MVTAAWAAPQDPNDILSQYRVFRLNTEEGAIYVRRLDQLTEHLWMNRSQIDELDTESPDYIGFDRSNRFLWLTDYSWYTQSTVIDLTNGRHRTLPYSFRPSTVMANSTGDQFIVSGYNDYRTLTPRLFDWTSDWNREGTEVAWFSDIVASRFDPEARVSTYVTDNDLVVVTDIRHVRGQSSFPMVIADMRSGSIVSEFEPEGLINPCLVIDVRDGEIFCRNGANVVRIDAETGALHASYAAPLSAWWWHTGLFPSRDMLIAVSSDWGRIEVRSLDRNDGTVFDSTMLDGWIELDRVDVPPPGDVAFFHMTDGNGKPTGIQPVLLDSLQLATFIAQDPNGYDTFAVGRAAPEWTPPAPATRTPTMTPMPTPTPCKSDVTIGIHPRTARPGEAIELRIDVASAPGCLQGFGVDFAPREGVRLETGGQVAPPCTSAGNEDPSLFSSFPTACDARGLGCTAGTSLLKAGYSRKTDRMHPMPERFSVLCRATVPLDATPVEGSIGVTLVEFDRLGRRPAEQRSVSLRVAGEAFTPTPTATTTPTRTATPTRTRPPAPTPCSTCPALLLKPIQAVAGGVAVVDVRLRSAGQGIVGLQTDLTVPADLATDGAATWRCRGNPFLRQRVSFRPSACDGDSCRSLRVLVYDLESGSPPLPDDMTLFTCRVAVSRTALPGIRQLVLSKALGSDAHGRSIPLSADATLLTIR